MWLLPACMQRAYRYVTREPNPIVQAFYLLLVAGGYGAFLVAGLPHLPNDALSEIHIYASFVVVLAALLSFISASTAPPGVLLPHTLEYFDNYTHDDVLYIAGRSCTTCGTTKLARSKHCGVCNVCVPRFDHHCVWLNVCIGEGNHVAFLRFLLANVVLTTYGAYVLFAILRHEFARLLDELFVHATTRAVVSTDARVAMQYLVHSEAAVVVLFALCSVLGTALLTFSAFHCYLVATNTTTNEFFKRCVLRRTTNSNSHAYDLGTTIANAREVWRPRYVAKAHAIAAAARMRKRDKTE